VNNLAKGWFEEGKKNLGAPLDPTSAGNSNMAYVGNNYPGNNVIDTSYSQSQSQSQSNVNPLIIMSMMIRN
jgi:hypothetical protein